MTHGTRDGFQSPKTFGEVGKEVQETEWQERGLAPPLSHRPSGLYTDNKQKTPISLRLR